MKRTNKQTINGVGNQNNNNNLNYLAAGFMQQVFDSLTKQTVLIIIQR